MGVEGAEEREAVAEAGEVVEVGGVAAGDGADVAGDGGDEGHCLVGNAGSSYLALALLPSL